MDKERTDEMLDRLKEECQTFSNRVKDLANEYEALFPVLMLTALETMNKAMKQMLNEFPFGTVAEMLKKVKEEEDA